MLAVCGLAIVIAAAAAAATGMGTLSANRRAAQRDAVSLLTRLRLPAASVRVTREPRGDSGFLRPVKGLIGSTAQVLRHAWFTVPGSPAVVIAYVEAHAPRAGKVDYTGRSGNTFTGLSSQLVAYAFPDLSGRIDERLLQVTVTALPGDRTGVLAESDSVWFVPRPTGERVPSGVRQVRVTAGVPRHAPSRTVTVADPAQIRRIARLVDGLAPAQPFAINCPAETDPRQITLRFLGAQAKRLARLDITAFRPWLTSDNGECGASLIFTVAGRRQAPLVAGAIVRSLQLLLGASLV